MDRRDPTPARTAATNPLLERLEAEDPVVAVELRPPSPDLPPRESMERWIDLHHTLRRLTRRGTITFLTDNAVGASEEENLRHLTTELVGATDRSLVVPFLTCKHPLDYCLTYAERAASAGIPALTVLGGDESTGPPRCVEHGYILRRKIRRRVPSLTLGGWANPHRDAARQVEYLLADDFTAEFYLTQVVSHHQMGRVEAFLEEARRRQVPYPGVFGVFFYRSSNPDTFRRLSRFFPVPEEALTREFESGAAPEEICARTIRALRDAGVRHVYVSNLEGNRAAERLEGILEAVESG